MPRYAKKDNPNGKKVLPSVTEIIENCTNKSGSLIQWAANMTVKWIRENCVKKTQSPLTFMMLEEDLDSARFNFRNISKEALNVGKEVHNEIENYLKGEPRRTALTLQASKSFDAFIEWEKNVNLKPILLEETIYGNGWAGTLDFYGYYKDKLYVIDWKTSTSHYSEQHGPQIAAYRYGLYKIGYKVQGSGILRIDKGTGIPDWRDYSDRYIKDLLTFNAMVKLYMVRYPEIEKKARN